MINDLLVHIPTEFKHHCSCFKSNFNTRLLTLHILNFLLLSYMFCLFYLLIFVQHPRATVHETGRLDMKDNWQHNDNNKKSLGSDNNLFTFSVAAATSFAVNYMKYFTVISIIKYLFNVVSNHATWSSALFKLLLMPSDASKVKQFGQVCQIILCLLVSNVVIPSWISHS